MLSQNSDVCLSTAQTDRRQFLFLRQVETLDTFLANGAISREQYDFSYSGLVTKMKITEQELAEWLGDNKNNCTKGN